MGWRGKGAIGVHLFLRLRLLLLVAGGERELRVFVGVGGQRRCAGCGVPGQRWSGEGSAVLWRLDDVHHGSGWSGGAHHVDHQSHFGGGARGARSPVVGAESQRRGGGRDERHGWRRGEVKGRKLDGRWREWERARWPGGRRPWGGAARREGGRAAPALHVTRGTAPPTPDRIATLADVVIGGEVVEAGTRRDVKLGRSGQGLKKAGARRGKECIPEGATKPSNGGAGVVAGW